MEYERNVLLTARSERVKGIDFHPTEPWVLTTLYSGHVNIWSFESKSVVKKFELTDVPVRAGRFISRENWIVCGSDDFQVRVYNYNTSKKEASFEAHPDYIRAIVVHPTKPFVLTASDDMTIKLWDWSANWRCVKTYEGHSHYVMGLAINPKDPNTFASACLDRTVKVWNIDSGRPNYTIEAHDTKGVNHVDYYPHADNPYLLTTSDDQTVKVWDYTSKQLVSTLGSGARDERDEGHTSNVSFACYHPVLPLIVSGSEDGKIKLWSSVTYKHQETIDFRLERAWCVSYQREDQGIAFGFDDGAVVVKIGRDDPSISMQQQGWLAWYMRNDLHIAKLDDKATETDGTPAPVETKKMEHFSAFYPQAITHSRRGQYFTVSGRNEYSIYSTRASRGQEPMKNVHQGTGSDFVWGVNTKTNNYAICFKERDGSDTVKIMANQIQASQPTEKEIVLEGRFRVEGLLGGIFLGVKGNDSFYLYDWDSGVLVKPMSPTPRNVFWSESGDLVAMAYDEYFTIFRHSADTYRNNVRARLVDEDGGVTDALESVRDVYENVRSGLWVGDCFVFTTTADRLYYLVGEQPNMIAPFDKSMYLLSYQAGKQRIYLADKDANVTSYALSLQLVEYQTLVLRGDMERAESILEGIESDDLRTKIARFLEGQGYKDMALEITKDKEHRFDLALALGNLDIVLEIARETDLEQRWKIVGDAAMTNWNPALAEECFVKARDLGSLLLLYTATGNVAGLQKLAAQAEEQAAHNIAFSSLWAVGDTDGCIDLLLRTKRVAEAVLLSRTYKPSRCREIVKEWKGTLEKSGKSKVSRMIALPPGGEEGDAEKELFPEWDEYLQLEEQGGHSAPDVEVNVANGGDDAAEDGENHVQEAVAA